MRDWLRKWFNSSQDDPWLVQTPLVRSVEQNQDFIEWKESPTARAKLAEILRAHEFHCLGIETSFGFKKLQSQGAEGVYFVPPSNWSNLESSHVYDWISWVAVKIGYKEAHSEQKTNWVNPRVGLREFRYLKPPKSVNIGQEIPQMFGNLLIERMVVKEKTQWIKIVSQFYQGRPYTKVKPFTELLDVIFDLEHSRDL